MNVADWSDDSLRRYGDYDAVIVDDRIDDRVWTNAVLHDRACRLASAFLALGVRPGDRVVLLLPNGVEMVVAFQATLRSGAVAVPLFAGASAAEIERIVGLSTPAAIVTIAGLVPTAQAASKTIPVRIAVGGDRTAGEWIGFDPLIEQHQALSPSIARDASDPAIICYTSGTSGAPKGVVHTHGSVQARHGGATRRLVAKVLVALPLGTLGASALTGRLAHQHTLVIHEKFEPRLFLSAIERHRVTKLVLVPSMGEALAALPDLSTFNLSSLRSVSFTGAEVPAPLLAKLAAVLPINPSIAYGMTETGGGIAASGLVSKPGSVGRILKGVDVRIVDHDGHELPCGQVGEIHVRTPWMGAEYFHQPDETAATFSDGWIRTGDLGYIDEDRELFLAGRQKDLIIQNGVKVAPREVVAVLRGLADVGECAVVGVPHALLGEQVVACVVRRAASQITADEILAHCRVHLDPRKVPVRVWFGDELPKTPNHKIDAPALRQRLMTEQAAVIETDVVRRLRSAAGTERMPLLRDVVHQQLLRILPPDRAASSPAIVDAAATFGELGLDSLRIAQLGHALGDALGRSIAPTLFFSHPTVDALCRHLVVEIAGSSAAAEGNRRARRVTAREPVAIIGFGCRLPGGADSPEQYWSLLQKGIDATADISRWNVDAVYDPARGTPGRTYTRRAALLDSPEMFDAEFFGIRTREALTLDPQHRLLLEVTWEAVEHAGYDPRSLSGGLAGLFVGINGAASAGGIGLGAAPSMAVGRICHFLDLRGPAVAVDTSCSSSLAAIHNAVQSLRLGECDVALAGGVQVIGTLRSFVALSEMSLMAADGRCKAFDASADGFGRGEGCVMIALKRLTDAEADRDRIIAVVRGTAARHDGRSSSLTAPNGRAQQDVIRAALEDGGVSPDEVDYLEAHGTGTPLGDPIELEAAMAVFANRAQPLVVGSVKTNIGHLESAAGAAGLTKVALALEHREIPAHLHCHTLNPLLESLSSTFVIPTTTQPWPETPGRRRIAGVTSMGLSGTNVHVVVEEAPPATAGAEGDLLRATAAGEEPPPRLLCLSARTDDALRQLAQRHVDRLKEQPLSAFGDYCFTANAGRAHFAHRLAVIARTPSEACDLLTTYASETTSRSRSVRLQPDPTGPPEGGHYGDSGSEALRHVADLYVRGVDPNWQELYGDGAFRRVTVPTYPFQRKRYAAQTADADLREAGAMPTRVPVANRNARPRVRAESSERRLEQLVDLVRRRVAEVVQRPPESLTVDQNCLDLGMDSLDVVDVVAAVRERTGIACTPADFICRASIAGFATYIGAQIASTQSTQPDADPPAQHPQLVVLNDRGSRAPLFCMHPSGGRATAYLRLRALLGDEQPLYALQSRALHEPNSEHETIESMAAGYAAVVQSVRPDGPYRLVGWSMGGLVALAVASELERRGASVESVGLIDVIRPGAHARSLPVDELAFALTAISTEVQPSLSLPGVSASDLDAVQGGEPGDLLAWCEAQGRIPAGTLSPETFAAMLRLYQRHFQLVSDYRPAVVDAPIAEWRASSRRVPYDWSKHSRAGVTGRVVGGSHFSVMHPPHIDEIAADLRCHQASRACAAGVTS